jgi:hypothetical protein
MNEEDETYHALTQRTEIYINDDMDNLESDALENICDLCCDLDEIRRGPVGDGEYQVIEVIVKVHRRNYRI